MDLTKIYNPEETEAPWYGFWESHGYFQPSGQGPAYSIVIPPPNVTGSLHMGHALNSTLQDILIRWHRMRGDRTVWVPGTDHGGIATQNVVEKLMKAEKKTRNDFGREEFLERMWQWRRDTGDTILMQLRRLGASCDWTRTRFTMDEELSKAVQHAFIALFDKKLIYRGPRMVNWCPRCQTALADIEVEHEDRAGKLWHIRYFADGETGRLGDGASAAQEMSPGRPVASSPSRYIVVATTRPETLLGDSAVAVNPTDERYQEWQGKLLRLPLTPRTIPILKDEAVDATFGTGAVKVTPAHDLVDFEIGERHQLPHHVVIGFDGKMTAVAGAYAGMDRFDARKKIVEDLEQHGLLEKIEDYKLSVAVCYRCGTTVEPLVSEQWFLRMPDIAARAAQATRDGRVRIFPQSWEKPYLSWLENIRDWCISRQIWWGHRIPVWYCPNTRPKKPDSSSSEVASGGPTNVTEGRAKCSPIAATSGPTSCPGCQSTDLVQDEDVLDTWFSSALWPMSVFGWPEPTDDLKTFYPTAALVTGHEILYLWVARMVMMGLEFQSEVPFRDVYIHGIVRDKQGKKMSKSLGNVVDPLEVMKKFGTDALRFSMAESSVPGRDLHLSDDSFLKARNFANKLWNVTRFVLMNLEGYTAQPLPVKADRTLADRWILDGLQQTIEEVTNSLANYNPAEAARLLYGFIWGSFCDWYVEISKVQLTGSDARAREVKQSVLIHVLEACLRLLHPLMPFETEQLYQSIKGYLSIHQESISIRPWPQADSSLADPEASCIMKGVQELTIAIRTVRNELKLQGQDLVCLVKSEDQTWKSLLADPHVVRSVEFLSGILAGELKLTDDARPPNSAVAIFVGGEAYLPLGDRIDKPKERERLLKDLKRLEEQATRGRASLENKNFIEWAPKEEVESRRAILREIEQKIEWIQRNLEGLL